MDSDTLHTASTYVNNLLLARGLLRDSKTIDFAKPTRESRAQIINLVHDLLLRRDRDQDSREQAALTLRTLRADATRKDAEIQRLTTRVQEKDRALVQAQAEARSNRVDLKRAEANVKALQEQVAKLKTSVGQVKTQCTNEIRKRDVQIERLKTHLQGQQRGNKSSVVAPSITITGGNAGSGGRAFAASVQELEDPEYSLKQETNEFLTQLSQSLSDENDGLIAMVRSTLSTIKELLGLPENAHRGHDSTVGSLESEEEMATLQQSQSLPFSYENLAADLEATMTTLKTLLTNPNFVSMEEVEIRDEEIMSLREGWEKMEARWKDVLVMMDGWRRRMQTGDTLNLDDLTRGWQGVGLDSIAIPARRSSIHHGELLKEVVDHEEAAHNSDSGVDDVHELAEDTESVHENTTTRQSPTKVVEPPDFFDLRPTSGRVLRSTSHNVRSSMRSPIRSPRKDSPRKVSFTTNATPEQGKAPEKESPAEEGNQTLGQLQTPTIVKAMDRSSRSAGATSTQSRKVRIHKHES